MRALTLLQQDLVCRHRGLVDVQLGRLARAIPGRLLDGLHDDLRHEGLLGLMEAAARWRSSEDAGFGRYAASFVRGRMTTWLVTQQKGYVLPLAAARKHIRRCGRGSDEATGRPALPQVFDLDKAAGALERMALRVAATPAEPADAETERERMRELYQAAVRRAGATIRAQPSFFGSMAPLVDAIIEERLLVPDPDYQTSHSSLARRFGVTVYRVGQCERRLLHMARHYIACAAAISRPRQDVACPQLHTPIEGPSGIPGCRLEAGFPLTIATQTATNSGQRQGARS